MTDTDSTDEISLLANTSAYAEWQRHSLHQTAGDIGLHVNASKTEYMNFKGGGAISTLNGKPLKFVGNFTYFGSKISSIESDANVGLLKDVNKMYEEK